MDSVQPALILVAQVLLGGAFLVAGLRNARSFANLGPVLAGKGVPLPRIALAIGLALEIGCGALLAIGLWRAFAAAGLILFVILATLIFHNFWAYEDAEKTPHVNAFIVNTALIGAFLLMLAVAG